MLVHGPAASTTMISDSGHGEGEGGGRSICIALACEGASELDFVRYLNDSYVNCACGEKLHIGSAYGSLASTRIACYILWNQAMFTNTAVIKPCYIFYGIRPCSPKPP